LTTSLAKELGPRKVRVNSVNPGVTETEAVHEMAGFLGGSEEKPALGKNSAWPHRTAHRHCTSRSVLASDEASWITGETIKVSGGLN